MTAQGLSWGQQHPILGNFASSSVSVGTGVALTNWVDVIKVRQQLAAPASRNLLSTGAGIVWHEGPLALTRGMSAALARGVLYGGLRIGLYGPMKDALGAGGKDTHIVRKVAAGMLSGAIAAGICNPTDLVKTRMQMRGAAVRNPFAIVASVWRGEGARGLWKGTTPSMARAALLTAAQCATYDEVKLFFLRKYGWEDSFQTHLTVSTIAGLVTATAVAPADMVKTVMFAPGNGYNGPLDCIADIYRRLGLRGFFRGWGAQWARQGPMTSIIFVVNEQVRMQLGMDTL